MMLGFVVSIHHQAAIFDEENAALPAHELVLRPILEQALKGVVFDAPLDSRPICEAAAILERTKEGLVIDLSQEVIHGFERFWNAGSCTRGTIAIQSSLSEEELKNVFRYCGEASEFDQTAQRTAFGTKALRFAAEHVAPGIRVFMLSRSNGIEWLGVYSITEESRALFDLAKRLCKPFKRWFEVSDPEKFNIIGQYYKAS